VVGGIGRVEADGGVGLGGGLGGEGDRRSGGSRVGSSLGDEVGRLDEVAARLMQGSVAIEVVLVEEFARDVVDPEVHDCAAQEE